MRATATERARLLLAELVGTFTLVFVGCGAIMVDAETDALGQVGIALAFGLAIAVMICAVGHVSGAHFNPAVTLAFALRRDFPWSLVPGYWIAQLLGALAAALLLRGSLGDVADVGTTQPAGSQGEAFLWELVLTFFLLFVITAVATGSLQGLPLGAAVAVGGTIAMASLVGGPVSGASLNPARSLAPALVSGNLHALWLYLVAPLVGGALGAFAYEFLRRG